MDKLKSFLAVHKQSFPFSDEKRKVTAILVVALVLLGVLGWLGLQKFTSKPSGQTIEMDLPFDAEGPYGLLFPRRDGNALILNLKRTASYDAVSYELAYTSKIEEVKVAGGKIDEGELGKSGESGVIDRGVVGAIDTKEKRGEYEQEILFGTCSKNVCKYDKGVENGTLTLHIKKGNKAFRMITQWHLQKPDVALAELSSGDGHFSYKVEADRQTLANVGFSITHDLTGAPKLPQGKEVLGKVYALNVPIAKELPGGNIFLELAQNPPNEAKLARYDASQNRWIELETKVDGSKLSGQANGGGIFAVLTNKK